MSQPSENNHDTSPEQDAVAAAPIAHEDFDLLIKPGRGSLVRDIKGVWHYRELFYFLVWRDVKVKYKQSVLGILWAILAPVVSMVVYTVIFGKMAGIDRNLEGLNPSWYPIFIFSGQLPWTYFAGALNRAGGSLVGSSNLITKVYFPRIIIPSAAALAGIVDFFFASLVMGGLMIYFGAVPSVSILAVVPLLVLTYLCVVGVGLLFAAVNVRFRDASFVLGFLVSLWFFVTPVIFPLSMFEKRFGDLKWILYANPMTGIVESFRWAILRNWPFPGEALLSSVVIIIVVLLCGQWYFRRVERTFADVI